MSKLQAMCKEDETMNLYVALEISRCSEGGGLDDMQVFVSFLGEFWS
jgi:hypothetical protein